MDDQHVIIYENKHNVEEMSTTIMSVPQDEEANAMHIIGCAALGYAISDILYTDTTEAFPVMLLEGMRSYCVAYAYDLNAIIQIAIRGLKYETIIKVFDEVFNHLKAKGYTPNFDMVNSQATRPIKELCKKEECKW